MDRDFECTSADEGSPGDSQERRLQLRDGRMKGLFERIVSCNCQSILWLQ